MKKYYENSLLPAIVMQKNRKIRVRSVFINLILALTIYGMFVPTVLLDLSLGIYQWVYFGLLEIPKIKRRKFVIIDRHRLRKLNWLQKLNCAYCGYANGVGSYAKAIYAQTEIYSCAIKHSTSAYDQKHQKDFFEYSEFEK